MIYKNIKVKPPGIRGRLAAEVVQALARYDGVTVHIQDYVRSVNAKSLLGLLSLNVGEGQVVVVAVYGGEADDRTAALDAVCALIKEGENELAQN